MNPSTVRFADRLGTGVVLAAVLATVALVNGCMPQRELATYTDADTGCQYLAAWPNTGIAPRLGAAGEHVGCTPPPKPRVSRGVLIS